MVDSFAPASELTSSNEIMLIESDDDPLIFPELRQKMKELYPAAQLFIFHDKGHFPYLNDTEKYNELLREFFQERYLVPNEPYDDQ